MSLKDVTYAGKFPHLVLNMSLSIPFRPTSLRRLELWGRVTTMDHPESDVAQHKTNLGNTASDRNIRMNKLLSIWAEP